MLASLVDLCPGAPRRPHNTPGGPTLCEPRSSPHTQPLQECLSFRFPHPVPGPAETRIAWLSPSERVRLGASIGPARSPTPRFRCPKRKSQGAASVKDCAVSLRHARLPPSQLQRRGPSLAILRRGSREVQRPASRNRQVVYVVSPMKTATRQALGGSHVQGRPPENSPPVREQSPHLSPGPDLADVDFTSSLPGGAPCERHPQSGSGHGPRGVATSDADGRRDGSQDRSSSPGDAIRVVAALDLHAAPPHSSGLVAGLTTGRR